MCYIFPVILPPAKSGSILEGMSRKRRFYRRYFFAIAVATVAAAFIQRDAWTLAGAFIFTAIARYLDALDA
jgi:hypothetical protein